MDYWLLKSEAADYSIDDFKKDKRCAWTGVRNYQARNFMTQSMKKGDLFVFYHSNAEPSGAAGVGEVISSAAIPDRTQYDPKSPYFDAKASPANPIWRCVEVSFAGKFSKLISLPEIRANKALAKMEILKKGSRLSITPLSQADFETLCELGSLRL